MLGQHSAHLPRRAGHVSLSGFGGGNRVPPLRWRDLMSRYVLALLAMTALTAPAAAQDSTYTVSPTPVAAPLSQRFVLIVLDQADRDLVKGDPKINMMFDTQTGRSWILEYSRKPNSNEQGYVWVEVPYAKPPTN
jgi:hypothetical protein